MVYITQLVFAKEGQEATFLEFENFAIPLMEQCSGKILYRIRPTEAQFIDHGEGETPYEIHFISFASEEDLQHFLADDERLQFMHLKEASVKSMLLVKGKKM